MKLEWAYLKLIRIQFILIIIAPIVIGIFLALQEGFFSWKSVLFLLIAACLEFVASVANDYGDGIRGIDGENRIGPERIFGLKKISAPINELCNHCSSNFLYIFWCAAFIFFIQKYKFLLFLVMVFYWLFCLWAALRYSFKSHSNTGLGDVSIFIFEGFVGVLLMIMETALGA